MIKYAGIQVKVLEHIKVLDKELANLDQAETPYGSQYPYKLALLQAKSDAMIALSNTCALVYT
ncbi:hypothetical protein D3C76_479120 [compost metagenome]